MGGVHGSVSRVPGGVAWWAGGGQRGHRRTQLGGWILVWWVTGRCCSLTSGVLPISSGWLGGGGGVLAALLSLVLDRGVQVSLLSAESLTKGWLVSGPVWPWCGHLWVGAQLFAALLGPRWQGGSRLGHCAGSRWGWTLGCPWDLLSWGPLWLVVLQAPCTLGFFHACHPVPG